MAYGDPNQIKSIRAKHNEVIVRDMDFEDRKLASGILLVNDNYKSEGIRPRWGQIYVVGPKQTRFKPGQWICVSHGRWTRGSKVDINGEEMVIRRVDLDEVLLVADELPLDETMGLAGVAAKS
jgi:hypothetical protein